MALHTTFSREAVPIYAFVHIVHLLYCTVLWFYVICIQGTYCVGSLMVTTKEWKSSVDRSVYPLIRIDKSALLYIYIFL